MTPHALPHLATRIFGQPLLIQRRKLDVILAVLAPRLNIETPEGVTVEAYGPGDGDRKKPYYVSENGIALIGCIGPLVDRDAGDFLSGGPTTYREIEGYFLDAVTDPKIRGVILDMDSPGGEAGGVFDLADQIYQARGMKPIYAVANEYAFSSAYAIASAAEQVYVTRTGGVGSVGVYMLHVDQSVFNEKVGVKPTYIFAGEQKVLGNPHEPLSDEARTVFQSEVDDIYDLFCRTVARNRRMDEQSVRATEAGCYFGEAAVAARLADRVGTLRDALADMDKATSLARPGSFSTAASAAIPTRGEAMVNPTASAEAVAEETTTATDEQQQTQEQESAAAESEQTTTEAAAPPPMPPPEDDDEEEDDEEETRAAETAPRSEGESLAAAVEAARAETTREHAAILRLCARAGKPNLGVEAIEKGLSLAAVKDTLLAAFIGDSDAIPISSAHDATPAPSSSGNAEAQLEAIAKGIQQSANIPYAQAYVKAMSQNPKLYKQYLAEKSATVKP